ncbi:lytic transglycosylase domain-containing protein [Thiohalobacter sp.]|uniref:lytic transglycosylase domain-containing protein n=1 Tax=Thiohalobacter sp. TaxID=2025948 RepID=UPI002616715E|nr:transglycosylase SLT domain-containing protein [Thiohalobacter sp.]
MLRFAVITLLLAGPAWAAQPPAPPDADRLHAAARHLETAGGSVRDTQGAFRLHCAAALLGNRDAAYDLGWMYLNGRGVRQDDGRAVGWLRRAAKAGDEHAARLLDHLSDIETRPDDDCPLSDEGPASRARIDIWIGLLAPLFGLDERLVSAVVRVESAYDPGARSHKGAEGLMQLMPATAARLGVADRRDPLANLIGGMRYLRWLLDRYQGDLRLALAGYNAGEAAVDRHDGVPPYAETRAYVQQICRLYGSERHPVGTLAFISESALP